ncbi:asparaginase [Aureococcus anophagefferens]|nr:asparaginase [Aureococcus anophagefferens]
MAPPLEILCITTGGSIDKTYSSLASDFVCAAPVLKGLLRDVKCAHRVAFREICRKDSLELSDGDRDAIVAAVAGAAQTHVLVTHGTDTLWKTALALKPAALKAGKVVALTGSMRPAAFSATDAHFNVGGAVAVLPYLPPGAHIVMNGRVFSEPDRIVKDYDRDVFHEGDLAPPARPPAGGNAATKKARAKSRESAKKKKPDKKKSRESVVVDGTLGLTDAEFEAQVLKTKKPPPKKKSRERRRRGRFGLTGEFESQVLKTKKKKPDKKKSRESVVVDGTLGLTDAEFDAQVLKAKKKRRPKKSRERRARDPF